MTKSVSLGLLLTLFVVASCSQKDESAKQVTPTSPNQIIGKWTSQTMEFRFLKDGSYIQDEKQYGIELGKFEFNPDNGVLVQTRKYDGMKFTGSASFPSQNELLLELPHSAGTLSADNRSTPLILKRVQE